MTDIRQLISSVWPELEPLREIGQGACSRVYVAERLDKSDEKYAIKVMFIPDDWEMEETRLKAYTSEQIKSYLELRVQNCTREVEIQKELDSDEHIVKLYDYKIVRCGEMEWAVLMRMELLSSLARVALSNQTEMLDIVRIGVDLCNALSFCHKRSIVHRDIKPTNVFLSENLAAKLGDFGVSRHMDLGSKTFTGTGTPQYMAPELTRSGSDKFTLEDGIRADVYSLGMVLYWLLNDCTLPFFPKGRIPTQKESQTAMNRRLNGEALPLPSREAPEWLIKAVMRAVEYKPSKRYADAEEFKAALVDGLGGKQAKKGGIKLLAAVLALIILAGGILAYRLIFAGENDAVQSDEIIAEASPKLNPQLSLALPDKPLNELVVYFVMPQSVWRSGTQNALFKAYGLTVNNGLWICNTTDDTDASYVRDIERLISSDFYDWNLDRYVDLIVLFDFGEDRPQDIIDRCAELGKPVFYFTSNDPIEVYNQWLRLMSDYMEIPDDLYISAT